MLSDKINPCGLEPQLIKLEFIIYLPKLKVVYCYTCNGRTTIIVAYMRYGCAYVAYVMPKSIDVMTDAEAGEHHGVYEYDLYYAKSSGKL